MISVVTGARQAIAPTRQIYRSFPNALCHRERSLLLTPGQGLTRKYLAPVVLSTGDPQAREACLRSTRGPPPTHRDHHHSPTASQWQAGSISAHTRHTEPLAGRAGPTYRVCSKTHTSQRHTSLYDGERQQRQQRPPCLEQAEASGNLADDMRMAKNAAGMRAPGLPMSIGMPD